MMPKCRTKTPKNAVRPGVAPVSATVSVWARDSWRGAGSSLLMVSSGVAHRDWPTPHIWQSTQPFERAHSFVRRPAQLVVVKLSSRQRTRTTHARSMSPGSAALATETLIAMTRRAAPGPSQSVKPALGRCTSRPHQRLIARRAIRTTRRIPTCNVESRSVASATGNASWLDDTRSKSRGVPA